MLDDMLLFQMAAAHCGISPLQVEGFLRVQDRFRVDLTAGSLPAVTRTSTVERHVRMVRKGRTGFAAASGTAGWDGLLEAAALAAEFGPVGRPGFPIGKTDERAPAPTESLSESSLMFHARDTVERIQQEVPQSQIHLAVEQTYTRVAVANGEASVSGDESRVQCELMVVMPDGQPVAVVRRGVHNHQDHSWGSILESARAQIGGTDASVQFDGTAEVCLLSGDLYPSLLRRYLAFALDPERLAADGAGFTLSPSPCLHLIHDPARGGRTLDDEGRSPSVSDIFFAGRMYRPTCHSTRDWLGEPAWNLGGVSVIAEPGHTPVPIGRGVSIHELAEVGYDTYAGICTALVTRGCLLIEGRPAGRLPRDLGVVIDIRGLIEHVLDVCPGPVRHMDEGSSPPVLVSGRSFSWC